MFRYCKAYINKKNRQTLSLAVFSLLIRANNYSATVESATTESATTESTAVVSTTSSSGACAGFVSLQDAKEIAAIATNIKTNFFIFFAFLNL
jgi:hypothetical protein